ncbi:unnamed protein product [Haemonchus placei]|uniref:AWS domain-containing protein n=1 Tax=Haemonchus placei TaxID=6290 RepID=A0A0N4W7F4_HAEPC|nr:unnamed protein product [Haemonchus placei]
MQHNPLGSPSTQVLSSPVLAPSDTPSTQVLSLLEAHFRCVYPVQGSILLEVILNCFQVAFNVPSGMCKVGKGGDCMRCDCKKPFQCYKGQCR